MPGSLKTLITNKSKDKEIDFIGPKLTPIKALK